MEAYRFSYEGITQEDGTYKNLKLREIREKTENGWPCPKLAFDIETRLAICLEHNNGKKQVCSGYPFSSKEVIFSGCGYSYIRKRLLDGSERSPRYKQGASKD